MQFCEFLIDVFPPLLVHLVFPLLIPSDVKFPAAINQLHSFYTCVVYLTAEQTGSPLAYTKT